MGPHSCVVSGCKNNTRQEGVSFFSLPRNKERFKLWLSLIGRLNLQDKVNCRRRVCSIHFEENMINNKRLKANAIPHLYLPKINTKNKPKLLVTKENGTQTIFVKTDKSTQVDFTDDDDDDDDDDMPSHSDSKMECSSFTTDIKIEKMDEPVYNVKCEKLDEPEYNVKCEIKEECTFENVYDYELTVKTEDF